MRKRPQILTSFARIACDRHQLDEMVGVEHVKSTEESATQRGIF
ncbi:hypothetical protein [Alicyclobacillus suci]|nr:hypothetical protein [Alicyclobacillus suci]